MAGQVEVISHVQNPRLFTSGVKCRPAVGAATKRVAIRERKRNTYYSVEERETTTG
jgi:hypothetical protein